MLDDTCAKVACPICGTASEVVLRRFACSEVAQACMPRAIHGDRQLQMAAHLQRLWGAESCEVRYCEGCEFGFSHPFVGGDAPFYELLNPDTPYPRAKWEFARTLEALAALPGGQPRDLLEVGAGKGHFLRQVLGLGWPRERILATEYSSAGRRAVEALGLSCAAADLGQLEHAGRFDVVCMFQVLEHLGDIEGVFSALDRLTRPGARAFFAVPNGERIEANEATGLLLDLPPIHVSRWRPATFARLAERFGWRLEACELEPPKRSADARGAFADRFVRLAQQDGSWAGHTAALAHRLRSRRAQRLTKLAGAVTIPSCWQAAFRPLLATARPANIWAQMARS